MSQSVVTRHLYQKLDQLDIKPEQKQSLIESIVQRKDDIKEALKSKQILVPPNPRPLSPVLKKAQNGQETSQQINETIRMQRLKEAERLQQQLKSKLETVSSSIEVLGTQNVEQRKDLMEEQRIARLKAAREKYFNKEGIEEENKMKEQAASFAKEQGKQQKIRRQMYKQYMKENQRKLEQELKKKEEEQQREMEKKQEEKIQKLKEKHLEMEQRKQERILQLEKDKEELKKYKQKKPLYKDIEEKYEKEILMPELERRKEELKKRREFYGNSIRSNDIYEHTKKYEANVSELKMKRERERKEKELDFRVSSINSNYNSTVVKELLEKERQIRDQESIAKKEKLELLQKRNRYGELVKSMYAPIPSVNKKLELEKLNETNITKPREVRLHEIKKEAKDWISLENQKKKNLNSAEKQRIQNNKQKVPKPKPDSQPAPPQTNSLKYKNYLDEIKLEKEKVKLSKPRNKSVERANIQNLMENSQGDKLQMMEKVKKKVNLLENQARRQELRLSNLSGVKNESLQANQQVSNLYIDSIKAKLALLENISK